jgi:hypothetical protein
MLDIGSFDVQSWSSEYVVFSGLELGHRIHIVIFYSSNYEYHFRSYTLLSALPYSYSIRRALHAPPQRTLCTIKQSDETGP